MSETWINMSLFATVILSGFYGGTGFFVRIGGNPAMLKMSDRTFAEYWKHTDYYMAARMKIFGPLLLLATFLSVSLNIQHWNTYSFGCLFCSLMILIADMLFVFRVNHPLNKTIQSWDISYLPGNVKEIKIRTVRAFRWRSAFMILSFIFSLLAIFLRPPQ